MRRKQNYNVNEVVEGERPVYKCEKCGKWIETGNHFAPFDDRNCLCEDCYGDPDLFYIRCLGSDGKIRWC